MNLSDIDVQDVPMNELRVCLQWLLGKLRVERAQWLVAQLTDRVTRQRLRDIFAVASRRDGQLVAVALAITQPPAAATLLALETEPQDNVQSSISRLQEVLAPLQSRLHSAGICFLQAAAESPEHCHRLDRLGFTHLADLAFLVLDAVHFSPSPTATSSPTTTPSPTATSSLAAAPPSPAMPSCRFETVGSEASRIEAACQLAADTFEATQDCPRLSEFRSTQEMVESYRRSTSFDPQLWQFLICDDKPIGCLFLTQHCAAADASGEGCLDAGGAVEISYMGLRPEYRGRGLGKHFLGEAARIAVDRQAPRMVLAVDRQNLPAITLYQRRGWVEAANESVWGLRILP